MWLGSKHTRKTPGNKIRAGDEGLSTATDADGNTSELGGKTPSVVDVESLELPPEELTLGASYPNQF